MTRKLHNIKHLSYYSVRILIQASFQQQNTSASHTLVVRRESVNSYI